MKNYRSEVAKAVEDVDFSTKSYACLFRTSIGDIRVDLLPDKAPKHCSNLVGLSRIGFYNGLKFHRVVKNVLVQAGCPEGRGTGGPGYSFPAELHDKPHDFGTLSMALTDDVGSAGSQFFICLDRYEELDGKYTIFGEVLEESSREVLRSFGRVATGLGDRPLEDVLIQEVETLVAAKAS